MHTHKATHFGLLETQTIFWHSGGNIGSHEQGRSQSEPEASTEAPEPDESRDGKVAVNEYGHYSFVGEV